MDTGDMRSMAKLRGGVCLSDTYVNMRTPMRWGCPKGHEWSEEPFNMKRRAYWCPTCDGPYADIGSMRELAESNSGKCLSERYLGYTTPHRWSCAKGHEWSETPGNMIRRKEWCRRCAGTEPMDIKEMVRLAADRGGKCLSTEYVNTNSPLRWSCAEGHEWSETPNNMRRRGPWCLKCYDGPKFYRSLDDDEKSLILSRYHGGVPIADIAAELDIHDSTVFNILRLSKTPVDRNPGMDGRSKRGIAARYARE